MWQLLAVTAAGHLFHWDRRRRTCLLRADLAPLCAAEGDSAVLGVRLSDGGAPVVLLANCNALAYDRGLQCWLRVADGAHVLSDFASSLVANAGGASGEVAEMNAAATAAAEGWHPFPAAAVASTHRPTRRAGTTRSIGATKMARAV